MNDTTIKFRAPAGLAEAMQNEARRQDISLSHLMRRLCIGALVPKRGK